MSNPLAGLIQPPSGAKPWKLRDGVVSTASPLTVLLDGDDDPVTPTKSPLVGGLAAGQRVLVMFADKQLIVLGRYGG